MNDFDQEKLDRLLNQPLTQYEKVLLERDRRERWKAQQEEKIERKFDWFIKDTRGEFYNYDPRDD
jgi:hypothetical protein